MNLLKPKQTVPNSTKEVLGFLQQQLAAAEPEPLLDTLGGLAKAFAVDAAGLGALLEAPGLAPAATAVTLALTEASWTMPLPDVLPWEKDAALLGRIKESGDVFEVQTVDGSHWLIAPVRQASASWIVWLTNRQTPNWSQSEKSCLALAGDCLVRRFVDGPEGAQWLSRRRRLQLQEGINRAAAVTRRLAHDFCNILTSISGFAELALLNLTTDSLARRYASEVLESAKQGARWSQKLQVFSLDRQQRFLPSSLAALLNDEQIRPDWHRGISLKVELPPNLPGLAIEPESLRLALSALLENAREAIAGQGMVNVSARETNLSAVGCLELLGTAQPGRCVEVTITDSGTGIPAEVRDRLFRDMFFTSKGRRRGLGLATVYGIMQSYHGGFFLDPAADRSGTSVKLLLPVAQPQP
jgi:signal transduction histidine kinase